MANHTPVKADAKEIKRAQDMWDGFTKLLTYSTALTVGVLVILAAIFIRQSYKPAGLTFCKHSPPIIGVG